MKREELLKLIAQAYEPPIENDTPELKAMRDARDRAHKASIAKDIEDEKPILDDLSKVGIVVQRLPDLFQPPLNQEPIYYKDGIPILLKWLPKVKNRSVQDTIIRAFCAPWAFPTAWKPLVKTFETMEGIVSKDLRWTIGNSLASIANELVFEDVLRLATDKRYGTARHMVVEALGKMKDPRAVDALIELLDDKDVQRPAIYALGQLKAIRARPKIEKFLSHPDSDYRTYAKRALAKIDRFLQKQASKKK